VNFLLSSLIYAWYRSGRLSCIVWKLNGFWLFKEGILRNSHLSFEAGDRSGIGKSNGGGGLKSLSLGLSLKSTIFSFFLNFDLINAVSTHIITYAFGSPYVLEGRKNLLAEIPLHCIFFIRNILFLFLPMIILINSY
jgi:hypothetical protein